MCLCPYRKKHLMGSVLWLFRFALCLLVSDSGGVLACAHVLFRLACPARFSWAHESTGSLAKTRASMKGVGDWQFVTGGAAHACPARKKGATFALALAVAHRLSCAQMERRCFQSNTRTCNTGCRQGLACHVGVWEHGRRSSGLWFTQCKGEPSTAP